MRLRTLSLTRYGHFNDRTLDFGTPEPGEADFHLIYGANEAGKSTALSAYMDLLFGIEKKTKYGFLHGYSAMHIGAVLETGKESLSLHRTKGNKDTLRSDTGTVIDPARLNALLHGLDREAYGAMFSLDGERLIKGGEAILASNGELGRALFSGTSGMSDIGNTLSGLRDKANGFFAPRTNKHELHALKEQLNVIEQDIQKFDTKTADFERLRENLATAKDNRDKAKQHLDDLSQEKEQLEKLCRAFPLARDLTDLRLKEQALSRYPPFKDVSLTAEVSKLRDTLTEIRVTEQTAIAEISRIDTELAGLDIDEHALTLKDPLSALDELYSRYQAGTNDLDKRKTERDIAAEEIKRNVLALDAGGHIAAEELILPVDKIADLETLIRDHDRLTDSLVRAEREHEETIEALDAAKRKAPASGPPAIDTEALIPAVRRIRQDDDHGTRQRAEKALKKAQSETKLALAALAPWAGDSDALLAIAPPSHDKALHWHERTRAAADDIADLNRRKAKDAQEYARLNAQITAMTQSEGIASDDDATVTRKIRDTAWQRHRASLTDETAELFEQALAADDRLQSARLAHSDRLAQLRELEQARAGLKAESNAQKLEEETLTTRIRQERANMSQTFLAMGLPAGFDPLDLPDWLKKYDHALDKIRQERAAADEHAIALENENHAKQTLLAALSTGGITGYDERTLQHLLDHCDGLIERANKSAQQYELHKNTLDTAKSNEAKRKQQLDDASEGLKTWQQNWDSAVSETWLHRKSPAQVYALLEPLRALPALLSTRNDLARRIEGMKQNIRRFQAELEEIAPAPPENTAADPGTRYIRLKERADTAHRTNDTRNALLTDKQRHQNKLDETISRISGINSRIAEIAKRYPESLAIQSADTLTEALTKSEERSGLLEKISSQEKALTALLSCDSVADAARMLDETSEDTVSRSLNTLSGTLDDADKSRENTIIAYEKANSAFEDVGGDAGVARIEEQRTTLLLDIQEKAEAHLRLSLGIKAAERALYLYRERHRSAMMTSTAKAFRTLTGGTYDRLVTQPDGNAESLLAIRSDTGASIAADAMSTGTRHQLYFALRLAGYEDFCARTGPLPLIADDILETFDDKRSAAAFQQLQALSHHGQTVYLTHHKHLCTIAQDICGKEVTIHRL